MGLNQCYLLKSFLLYPKFNVSAVMEFERPKRKIVGQESTYSKEIIVFLNTMTVCQKGNFKVYFLCQKSTEFFFHFFFFFSFKNINSGDHFLLKTIFFWLQFLNNFFSKILPNSWQMHSFTMIFFATGHGASVQQGLDVIARQGRFVVFSVFNGDVLADWSLIGKVHIFWEGHKILQNLHQLFDWQAT